jgi:Cu/Zn superoxide dismutase
LSAGSYTGTFSNVADAPTGSKPVAGKATMVISASGTKVSIDATGLDPKAVYVAHVHNQPCATEEGGKHFQFDPSGPMAPPNEIWLTPVKVSPKGTGTATVTAPGKANSSAKSVVIHLKQAAGAPPPEAGAKPPKLACADLAHK